MSQTKFMSFKTFFLNKQNHLLQILVREFQNDLNLHFYQGVFIGARD